MNNKEIHELIKLIDKSDLAEFKMKQGDFSISIRSKEFFKGKGQQIVSMAPAQQAIAPAAPTSAAPPAEAKAPVEAEETSKYVEFKSPMVGTFYRKPSPDKPKSSSLLLQEKRRETQTNNINFCKFFIIVYFYY